MKSLNKTLSKKNTVLKSKQSRAQMSTGLLAFVNFKKVKRLAQKVQASKVHSDFLLSTLKKSFIADGGFSAWYMPKGIR